MGTDIVTTSTLTERMNYAQALAASALLPEAYRKQPANVLYAVEYGAALGVPPLTAITGIHIIKGKPTLSADLMAALIRRAGHRLRVRVEKGPTAIAELTRSDDPEFTYVCRWDMARADAAQLTGKDNWVKNPQSMLKARAISEVAREGCSEVLNGLIYTAEELGADTIPGASPPMTVDIETGEILDGEIVEDTKSEPETVQEPSDKSTDNNGGARSITPAQIKLIAVLMHQADLNDRDDALAYVNNALGNPDPPIKSRSELTRNQGSVVIDALQADGQAMTAAPKAERDTLAGDPA